MFFWSSVNNDSNYCHY